MKIHELFSLAFMRGNRLPTFDELFELPSFTSGTNKYLPHDGSFKANRERNRFNSNPNIREHARRMNSLHERGMLQHTFNEPKRMEQAKQKWERSNG